jgi:hypothetical protein
VREGICFDRKEEEKKRRGERDQSREDEDRDGRKEGRNAEEIRQENYQDERKVVRMTRKFSG